MRSVGAAGLTKPATDRRCIISAKGFAVTRFPIQLGSSPKSTVDANILIAGLNATLGLDSAASDDCPHPLSSDAPLIIDISFERQVAFRESLSFIHQVNAMQSGMG